MASRQWDSHLSRVEARPCRETEAVTASSSLPPLESFVVNMDGKSHFSRTKTDPRLTP